MAVIMSSTRLSLAILFADIVQSTQIYELLGDRQAQLLIARCLSVLSQATEDCGGKVIKTIGDEVMCTFADGNTAFGAAKAMHQALERMPMDLFSGYAAPAVRIGLHMGPVIQDGGDVFGDAVIVAARLVALAKQRQILTTEQTLHMMAPGLKSSARLFDKTTIKGRSGKVSIYEMIWEQQDLTLMLDRTSQSLFLSGRLELGHQGQTVCVDQFHPCVTLGRRGHNDLVVTEDCVSRTHAQIEFRRGKFVLADNSTNGTYIHAQGQADIYLKKDEVVLEGEGLIGCGQRVVSASPQAIRFICKQS